MNWQVFLTDEYFKWLLGNYSFLIFTVAPWAVLFILQVIAIIWPGAKSNQIRELFQAMWPKRPVPTDPQLKEPEIIK
jgi:hypothetical protein